MECYVDAGRIVKVRGVTPRDCVHLALAELGPHAQSPVTVHLPVGDEEIFVVENGEVVGTLRDVDAEAMLQADEAANNGRLDAFAADLAGKLSVQPEMACRVCGCTDSRACAGGCFWVVPYLCSQCAGGNTAT